MLETTEAAAAAALHLLLPPPPAPSTVSPTDRPQQQQQRWLRPLSARRRPRTTPLASSSSSTTSGVVDPGQEDGFRTAYDAYHETNVTLDPLVHGLLPRRSNPSTAGGQGADGDDRPPPPPEERPSTGEGSHRFGALYPGCRLPLQLVHLDYQDFAPALSGFDDSGNLRCFETFA